MCLLFSGFLIELPVYIFGGDYVACSFLLTSSFYVFFKISFRYYKHGFIIQLLTVCV